METLDLFLRLAGGSAALLLLWLLFPLCSLSRKVQPIRKFHHTHLTLGQNLVFPTCISKHEVHLSLVVPAYNESKRITKMLRETLDFLEKQEYSWEIIVVNDGSSDNTVEVVSDFAKAQPKSLGLSEHTKLRTLDYKAELGNQGKGFAVQQGMLHARGRYVLFLDADGASDIEDVRKLLAAMKECETSPDAPEESLGMVCGSRHEGEVDRSLSRKIFTTLFHFFVEILGGVTNVIDTQCGFKLFTREAVRRIFPNQRLRRWCFDVELIGLANKQNIPVREVPIRWREIPGSKISPVRAGITMLREMFLIRLCYTVGYWAVRTSRPPST